VPEALDAAITALARRDLTERELLDRLSRLGIPPDEGAEVVERLRKARYLDDAKVAAERAARLADRGHGDAAIAADLTRRGVPAALVAETLAELEPERARAARAAERLGGGPRAARALVRKGFATDSIEHVLAGVAEEPL
jgi:SOS response regulatory protein OraA/RecX